MASFVRSAAALALLLPALAGAQASRHVNGVVVRAVTDTTRPVAGQWVVLHHVGRSAAGPVDSVKTDARGRYEFKFTVRDSAVYFASSMYAGVAYFTSPFMKAKIEADSATITVFDTSSTGPALATRSHHIIVFRGGGKPQRRLSEVYWLENTSVLTRVGSPGAATWSALIPANATNFRLEDGDVAAQAVTSKDGRVEIAAPFAPGMRQIQFSYELPASDFPLRMPVDDTTGVLEVLVEDSLSTVRGAGLTAQQGVAVEGRTFQRFLAQGVPSGAIFDITLPQSTFLTRGMYVAVMLGIVGVALLIGLARAVMRPGAMQARHAAEPERATQLAYAIAALDAKVERQAAMSDEERASYHAKRESLKAELTAVLAERDDRL